MMDALNFAYWLQGFVELTQGQTPNPAQWKSIKEHLDLVFTKVAPLVGETTVSTVKIDIDAKDAKKTIEDLAEVMQKYRQSLPTTPFAPFDWSRTIVTC